MMNIDIRYLIEPTRKCWTSKNPRPLPFVLSTTTSTSTSRRHRDTFLLTEIALAELAAFPTKETVNALELNPADYEDWVEMGICSSCCNSKLSVSHYVQSQVVSPTSNDIAALSPSAQLFEQGKNLVKRDDYWLYDSLSQGSKSNGYEPLLLENEREAVADLLQYLESKLLFPG